MDLHTVLLPISVALGSNSAKGEYAEFVPSAVIPPRENWSTAFESIMDEELSAAFIGEKTPEQALADAQTRLEDFALFE